MNGIEKITQRMEDDAQREINEVLTAARAQADELTRHRGPWGKRRRRA